MSCTAQQLQAVTDLVGEEATATAICNSYDVGSLGVQAAVLRYLANAQSSTSSMQKTPHIYFILFSGYLVFIMQAGFAMVSGIVLDTGPKRDRDVRSSVETWWTFRTPHGGRFPHRQAVLCTALSLQCPMQIPILGLLTLVDCVPGY